MSFLPRHAFGGAVLFGLLPCVSFAQPAAFLDATNLLGNSSHRSGVAMGVTDMNGDGLDDIVHLDDAKTVYVDLQRPGGGSFASSSLGTVSSRAQWGMALGDIDDNGFPDIVTGGYYDGLHFLRANQLGTNYSTTTLGSPTLFLQAVNFVDIDGDGNLDIFACHDDDRNVTFRNTGSGSFVYDASLIDTGPHSGNYGSLWTDYDGDGDLDLYIAKCRAGVSDPTDPRRINQLFRNDGASGYVDVAPAAGLALGEQSWTADFADIDNDGDLDCFVGNHMAPSTLLRNRGDGTFENISSAAGMSVNFGVIQSVFRDFNSDGYVDLLLTGGQHELWMNDGDGTFSKAANPFPSSSVHSAAIGDLNHDGFPDVFAGRATGYNSPSGTDQLFLSSPNGNRFLSIRLEGTSSNRLGSGAWLEARGPWGTQIREVRTGEGYAVTHASSQRFGLGSNTVVPELIVRWPAGTVDVAHNVAADQFLTLVEGGTQAPTISSVPAQTTTVSSPVSLTMAATDPTSDALTFSASGLPAGLSIAAGGEISGTPTSVGTSLVTVSVTDGWSTVSTTFLWTIEPGDGSPGLVLTPTHDTLVKSSRPTRNYSGQDHLRTRFKESAIYHSYLKFEVPSSVGTVGSATLRLYCYDGSYQAGALFPASNELEGSPWVETDLTWNAQPEVGPVFAQLGTIANETWVEIDVTSLIAGPGEVSFALRDGSGNSAFFDSKEGGSPPQLVLDTEVSLEPMITSMSPVSGPVGTSVTLTGANLFDVVGVTFAGEGGRVAADFAELSDSELLVVVPEGAADGVVEVDTIEGVATSEEAFDVVVPVSSLTLNPTHDGHVKSSNPTTSYGNSNTLRGRAGEPVTYRTFLKFDVAGIVGSVERATLRMFVVDGSRSGGTIHQASNEYGNSAAAWTESGLTQSSAPDVVGPALASRADVARGEWVEWDVTPAVSADGVISFVLEPGSSNSVMYFSSEGTYPPELVVEIGSGGAELAGVSNELHHEPTSRTLANLAAFSVHPNEPNPFRDHTTMRFSLPRATSVAVGIYDVTGREVRSWSGASFGAGRHELVWDARDNFGRRVGSGVYLMRIQAGEFSAKQKLTLLK